MLIDNVGFTDLTKSLPRFVCSEEACDSLADLKIALEKEHGFKNYSDWETFLGKENVTNFPFKAFYVEMEVISKPRKVVFGFFISSDPKNVIMLSNTYSIDPKVPIALFTFEDQEYSGRNYEANGAYYLGSNIRRDTNVEKVKESTSYLFTCLQLLLANFNEERETISFEDVPRQAKLIKGKRTVQNSFSRVVLHLDKAKVWYSNSTKTFSEESLVRRHQVRGHWKNWHRNFSCEHAYVERRENSYGCCKCGQIKTWVKEHHRGDDNLGTVEHYYKVKN